MLLCLANHSVFDPKHSMVKRKQLVDETVKKLESACIKAGNSLRGVPCGRTLYHVVMVS